MPTVGSSWATPAANADADAACPEGNDVLRGIATWRAIGTRYAARSGRRRRPSGLSPRLTTVDVRAIGAGPSAAARRPRGPPATARPAATEAQSLEWSAAREMAAKHRSSVGVGVAEIAAYTATSSASTSRHQWAPRSASGALAAF